MTTGQPRRAGEVSAAELAAGLRRDPEFVRREQAEQRRRAEAQADYQRAAGPLLADLAREGFPVESVDELRRGYERTGERYEPAIPVLLRWLPRVAYRPLQWSITEALAVPWAKREAARPLVERFRSLPPHAGPSQDPRWEVGNALAVLAHQAVADDLLELAQDTRYGTARQPIVLGLGKLNSDPRVVPVLLRLLDDPEVAGFAIASMGRLKAAEARESLRRYLDHPSRELRIEARKALNKIDKAKR